jgi:hypothetical protein
MFIFITDFSSEPFMGYLIFCVDPTSVLVGKGYLTTLVDESLNFCQYASEWNFFFFIIYFSPQILLIGVYTTWEAPFNGGHQR